MSYVIYKGKKYNVNNGLLDLSQKGIRDIFEIKRLKNLSNLQKLDLSNNQISEIKGLKNLTNLKALNLSYNYISDINGLEKLTKLQNLNLSGNHQISEIKGLEMLTELNELILWSNPIKHEEYYFINKEAQEVVRYYRIKKTKRFEFDFAFSFAGEDREIVEKVYDSLIRRKIKVFYDKSFEWYLAGKDLDKSFKEIYGKKSKYVVVFVSRHYPEKKWADFERQIAEKAAQSRKEEYIIPVRIDNTITYGIKSTNGYINYQKKRTRGVADILEKKLKDFNKRHNIK